MVRRTFLKKAALAAVGAAVASPLSALAEQPAGSTRKKKVLLINGSPRPDGNTACALQEIAGQLQKHGIETEIFQIGTKAVHMCVNCGGCRSGRGCVFNDDPCNEIAARLADADALVVGSPVYYGQPNGGVLAVMQRLFYSNGKLVQNKPAAAVAVCRRGGATATLQTMNMMFEMTNMPVIGSQYWNIVYGRDKGEAKLDKEGMQTMRTLASNMAWLLEKIHAGGSPAPVRENRREVTNFIR